MEKSKAQKRFEEKAQKRVNLIIKSIMKLRDLSLDPAMEFTEDHVNKIKKALQSEVRDTTHDMLTDLAMRDVQVEPFKF